MIKKHILLVLLSISFIFAQAQITEIGKASFYGKKFHGRITASGEKFNMHKMTAAHRTLPFGTEVRVTNIDNNKQIKVTINDRGPFVKDRIIDLSKAAAEKLGFIDKGVATVKVEVLKLAKTAKETKPAKPKTQSPSNTKPGSEARRSQEFDSPEPGNQNTYYQVKSESVQKSGYGVQILSYKEAANMLEQIEKLEKQYNSPVVIQVGGDSGNRLYRVIMGNFKNRTEADHLKNKLKKDFKGCFVIQMQ
jgi:rare lipoprotein A